MHKGSMDVYTERAYRIPEAESLSMKGNGGTNFGVQVATNDRGSSFSPNPSANLVGP
jgi:hypothetical protein